MSPRITRLLGDCAMRGILAGAEEEIWRERDWSRELGEASWKILGTEVRMDFAMLIGRPGE